MKRVSAAITMTREGNVDQIIDGKAVSFPRGTTILEAARIAGIYILFLCHHPDPEPIGIFMLCLVQIEGWNIFHTPCADGTPWSFP